MVSLLAAVGRHELRFSYRGYPVLIDVIEWSWSEVAINYECDAPTVMQAYLQRQIVTASRIVLR